MKKHVTFLMCMSTILFSLNAQTVNNNMFENYDKICYCSVGLAHPQKILDMDNNLEIVFRMGQGKSLRELKLMGTIFNKSQIELLLASGLIEKKDSLYLSGIPFLNLDETIKIRSLTRQIAKEIIPEFKNDYDILSKTLISQGLKNNTYSILFTLILDNMVWDYLELDNQINKQAITREKPFWDGVMWLIEPKRSFFCGTNSLTSDNISINVNWSENSGVKVKSYRMLEKLLIDYKELGKIVNPEVIKSFKENGLVNENGELLFPVIKADSTDVIYKISEKIAKKVEKSVVSKIDLANNLNGFSNLDKSQKIIILYHEIMWDILDIMEEKGLLMKPIAFSDPSKTKPSDLKDLIFIVKNAMAQTEATTLETVNSLLRNSLFKTTIEINENGLLKRKDDNGNTFVFNFNDIEKVDSEFDGFYNVIIRLKKGKIVNGVVEGNAKESVINVISFEKESDCVKAIKLLNELIIKN